MKMAISLFITVVLTWFVPVYNFTDSEMYTDLMFQLLFSVSSIIIVASIVTKIDTGYWSPL